MVDFTNLCLHPKPQALALLQERELPWQQFAPEKMTILKLDHLPVPSIFNSLLVSGVIYVCDLRLGSTCYLGFCWYA